MFSSTQTLKLSQKFLSPDPQVFELSSCPCPGFDAFRGTYFSHCRLGFIYVFTFSENIPSLKMPELLLQNLSIFPHFSPQSWLLLPSYLVYLRLVLQSPLGSHPLTLIPYSSGWHFNQHFPNRRNYLLSETSVFISVHHLHTFFPPFFIECKIKIILNITK